MAFFNFPHTRTYDTDLGWLIAEMNKVRELLNQYLENAVITFADPITWDITNQYPAMTMVVDSDGTAYLSRQPVPAGVDISNTNYWLPVFNYDDNINEIRSQIAYNARDNATTAVALIPGDLVFWKGLIYKVTAAMPAGTAFIIGSNIEKYTVSDRIQDIDSDLQAFKETTNTRIEETAEASTAAIEQASAAAAEDADKIRDTIAWKTDENGLTVLNMHATDLIYKDDVLYECLVDIPVGSALVLGENVKKINVSDRIKAVASEKSNQFWFMPEDYGAFGDGETDDGAAIQAMFDAMEPGDTAVFSKKWYVCNRQINITKNNIRVTGGFTGAEYTSVISSSQVTGSLFYVTGIAGAFDGVEFVGPGKTGNNLTLLTIDNDNEAQDANSDFTIFNCAFISSNTDIDIFGRQVHIKNCTLSNSANGVIWEQTRISTELRGHLVEDCRFHGVTNCIRNNINNTLDHKHVFIKGNVCDADCRALFGGYDGGVYITGNIINLRSTTTGSNIYIALNANAYAATDDTWNVIANNIFYCGGKSYGGILLQGTGVKAAILNNYFEESTANFLYVPSAASAQAIVKGNTIRACTAAAILAPSLTGLLSCNSFVNCGGTWNAPKMTASQNDTYNFT